MESNSVHNGSPDVPCRSISCVVTPEYKLQKRYPRSDNVVFLRAERYVLWWILQATRWRICRRNCLRDKKNDATRAISCHGWSTPVPPSQRHRWCWIECNHEA
ncbi:MAG: hypothetical protein KAT85_06055, partial [candidate division Zixibacteria bacterium]|nr:hypothetical protein [candidate division Zixibacteria bacterium]